MAVDFIGAGWNFPLQVDATNADRAGDTGPRHRAGDRDHHRTAPGERPMRPEFGCRIQDHLFSPTNEATAAAIAYDVRRALELWEPRIDVEDVRVGFDPYELGMFYIDVGYRSAATTTNATWSSRSM